MNAGRSIRQLCFDFVDGFTRKEVPVPTAPVMKEPAVSEATRQENFVGDLLKHGRDRILEAQARASLAALGLHEGAAKLTVTWKPRMRSTAGYARWPAWAVELNPKLIEFEGQVERTLKHELAHLIAYARAGKRRIEPHGREWRKACIDLGIPDETVRHTLPLPRVKQTRKFSYSCASCGNVVERVRKFGRATACLTCCRKYNGGRYDARFQFVLVRKPFEIPRAHS